MPNTVKRLNYYDHQFLRAPDFTDEQTYHLSLRRLHNSLLHTWGIVTGLQVTVASGGTGTAVSVNAGVALDSTGRELVLPADTNLELGGEAPGTTLYITIAYDEQQSDPTTEAGGPGNTRITEMPKLSFSQVAPDDKSMTLILAQVPRTATGLGTVNVSDRKDAGVALGSDITINTLTLKKDGVAQPNWPVFNCSGANQAALANAGLTMSGSLGIGPSAPNRNLSVSGAGSTGVYANIKNANHEVLLGVDAATILSAMTASDLQIRTNNQNRAIVQANTGNIGIGTDTPAARLHVVSNSSPTALRIHSIPGGWGSAKLEFWSDAQGSPTEWRPGSIQSIDMGGGTFTGGLAFLTNGTGQANRTAEVEVMRVANGRLGLGITTPDRKMTISEPGAGPGTGVYANVKNSAHEILIGVDAATIVSAMTNSDLQLRTNNANRVIVSAGTGTLTALADVRLANSDIYFTQTNHNHTGFGNAPGYAAIENAANYGALMILGRTMGPSNALVRTVKLWDFLQVNGNLEVTGSAAKPGGGSWTALSDQQLKKNINPLKGALDRLLSLRGVTFEWNEPEKYGNQVGTQIGLVAQEVEKVFPDWVGTDSAGFKTVTVRGLEALAIEAFREVNAEIAGLKKAVGEVQSSLARFSQAGPAQSYGLVAGDEKPAEKPAASARKTGGSSKK